MNDKPPTVIMGMLVILTITFASILIIGTLAVRIVWEGMKYAWTWGGLF